MNLNEVLLRPEVAGMTPAEFLTYGDQIVVVGGTDELWSYSGVAITFGDLAAEGLLQAIQGAGLVGASQVYLGKGMQLSLPSVQDKLTAIAAGLRTPSTDDAKAALAGVCDALKEIGITHGTRWVKWGITKPTVEQVNAAIDANATTAWWHQVRDEVVPARIVLGDSIDQIKAAITASN